MIKFCPYCSALHKAIANQNYCSNMGDKLSSVSTNAYYFKSNKLNSGDHVSRLSIRTVSDGYQYHQVNKKDLILKKDNYLLINEGEEFYSEISTQRDVEGILVAFDKADVLSLFSTLNKNEQQCLDDPFHIIPQELDLESQSVDLSNELKLLLIQVKYGIVLELHHEIYFEELFMKILKRIFDDQTQIIKTIDRLEFKKASTKREIFRRVSISKDFIDGHLEDDLTIKELSKVAMMSPFHYVRSFKKLYRLSPHQYLTTERIKRSKFLLHDTENNIGDICQQVGFVNSSSFTRLFKRNEGCTPQQYRSKRA